MRRQKGKQESQRTNLPAIYSTECTVPRQKELTETGVEPATF